MNGSDQTAPGSALASSGLAFVWDGEPYTFELHALTAPKV